MPPCIGLAISNIGCAAGEEPGLFPSRSVNDEDRGEAAPALPPGSSTPAIVVSEYIDSDIPREGGEDSEHPDSLLETLVDGIAHMVEGAGRVGMPLNTPPLNVKDSDLVKEGSGVAQTGTALDIAWFAEGEGSSDTKSEKYLDAVLLDSLEKRGKGAIESDAPEYVRIEALLSPLLSHLSGFEVLDRAAPDVPEDETGSCALDKEDREDFGTEVVLSVCGQGCWDEAMSAPDENWEMSGSASAIVELMANTTEYDNSKWEDTRKSMHPSIYGLAAVPRLALRLDAAG